MKLQCAHSHLLFAVSLGHPRSAFSPSFGGPHTAHIRGENFCAAFQLHRLLTLFSAALTLCCPQIMPFTTERWQTEFVQVSCLTLLVRYVTLCLGLSTVVSTPTCGVGSVANLTPLFHVTHI